MVALAAGIGRACRRRRSRRWAWDTPTPRSCRAGSGGSTTGRGRSRRLCSRGPSARRTRRASRPRMRWSSSTGRTSRSGRTRRATRAAGRLRTARMVVLLRGTPGGGTIRTRQEFGPDLQLHVEFATPSPPKGTSQGRGNSGVYLCGPTRCRCWTATRTRPTPTGRRRDLRPVPAAGERLPQPGRVADLRHHLPAAAVRGRQAAGARVRVPCCHNGVLIHHHAERAPAPWPQRPRPTKRTRQGAARLPEPRQPGPLPQHLAAEAEGYDEQYFRLQGTGIEIPVCTGSPPPRTEEHPNPRRRVSEDNPVFQCRS